ncbi:MAG: DUF192 domain-containing protein [Treponema sp.]|jgi:uncharacterized membrane protein (UPF0127 family)|nr:DUF192 domain-containing protein [Treponema sp.]
MRKLFFMPVFLLFALACGKAELAKTDLPVIRKDGSAVALRVEIARTPEERSRGFMERKHIPAGTGMLFVFDQDQPLSFWMKNTPAALSIAYIDSSGVIREIHDMTPFSLSSVNSAGSVRYALEVPQGWFGGNGIAAGDRVVLDSISDSRRR